MLYQEYSASRPPVSRRRRPRHDEDEVLAELRQSLLGGRFVSALTGSAPISPELKAWVEALPRHAPARGLRLDRGRRRVRRRRDPASAGDRLQAGRRARARLLRHRQAAPARRAAGQDPNSCSPATTSGPRSPPRCSTPTATTAPATSSPRLGPDQVQLRRPAQQRAQAVAGRVRHRLQARGGVRRQPAGAADLHLRQQRPALPAGRRRAHRGRAERVTTPTSSSRSSAQSLQGRAHARRTCSPTRSRATSSSRRRLSRWRTDC